MKTARRSGTIKKSIKVQSNDPNTPQLVLTIKGNILVDVSVSPRSLSFGQIGKNESKTIPFTITVADPEKTKIQSVKLTDTSNFSLKQVEGEHTPITKYELTFAGESTPKRITNAIEVLYDSGSDEKLSVPVRVSVVSDLRYQQSVFFRKIKGAFKERQISISSRTKQTVNIKKTEDSAGLLTIVQPPKTSAHDAILKLSVKNQTRSYDGKTPHVLKIYTDSKDQPLIEIKYTIDDSPNMRPMRKTSIAGRRKSRNQVNNKVKDI